MGKVTVETSARHVHLDRKTLDILFGEGYELTVKKTLSIPSQFAANERVDLVGPKNTIKNVSILGPTRKATQVEVTLTEARTLGISVPVRLSGDLKGSAGIKLVGPKGEVEIEEGVIVAKRHLHIHPDFATKFGISQNDIVSLKYEDGDRPVTFGNVVVRFDDSFPIVAAHIDTDEANAAGISGNVECELIK